MNLKFFIYFVFISTPFIFILWLFSQFWTIINFLIWNVTKIKEIGKNIFSFVKDLFKNQPIDHMMMEEGQMEESLMVLIVLKFSFQRIL